MNDKGKKEVEEWLKKAGPSTVHKVSDSSVFMSLFTEGYEKDPLAVLQFGYAVLMDKPIYVVAPEGTKLPENVKILARRIERFDEASAESASTAAARCVEHFQKENPDG